MLRCQRNQIDVGDLSVSKNSPARNIFEIYVVWPEFVAGERTNRPSLISMLDRL
jgi:hypothetical protein